MGDFLMRRELEAELMWLIRDMVSDELAMRWSEEVA